MIELRCLCVL